MLLAPGDVNVTSHWPADTAATHWLVPSVTVTLPVSGALTDPGWLDTHEATVAWGDLATTTSAVDQTARTIADVHIYDVPGSYEMVETVVDDDGGVGVTSVPLTVLDASGAIALVAEVFGNSFKNHSED